MNREGKKCVLYPRVSTEMQVDGYSLEGQKNSLKRFADREEMEIVGIYEDAGKSGKSIEGRPAFKKMLSDIKNGLEIDYILVYKLSRFGRNAADILNSLEFVQSYGINLICIEEGIDSSQTSGKLLISVLSAVAEIERENIIEQTMNGRKEKARQGGWNGGFAPYKAYEIILENDKKEVLSYTEPKVSAIRKAGTKVEFDNIFSLTAENMAFEVLEPALLKEFAWFLYLCKGRNLKININGKPIEYEKYINTEFSEKTITTIAGSRFEVTLIVWAEAIKEKFCCYFFDSKDEVKSIETTSFNRNTVEFNHSVFVKSDFFDGQENDCMEMESDQISLFTDEDDKKVYKELKKFIAKFIEKKIGNYMSQKADDAVRQMIEERKTWSKRYRGDSR